MKKQRIYFLIRGCLLVLFCVCISNCQDDQISSIPTIKNKKSPQNGGTHELSRASSFYMEHREEAMQTRSVEANRSIIPYKPFIKDDPSW